MKRKSAILLFLGVAIVAIISGVATSTHLRLSATEGQEHENGTPQEIANEILTGQPAHSEEGKTLEAENNTVFAF